jgi:hypothetical protein
MLMTRCSQGTSGRLWCDVHHQLTHLRIRCPLQHTLSFPPRAPLYTGYSSLCYTRRPCCVFDQVFDHHHARSRDSSPGRAPARGRTAGGASVAAGGGRTGTSAPFPWLGQQQGHHHGQHQRPDSGGAASSIWGGHNSHAHNRGQVNSRSTAGGDHRLFSRSTAGGGLLGGRDGGGGDGASSYGGRHSRAGSPPGGHSGSVWGDDTGGHPGHSRPLKTDKSQAQRHRAWQDSDYLASMVDKSASRMKVRGRWSGEGLSPIYVLQRVINDKLLQPHN